MSSTQNECPYCGQLIAKQEFKNITKKNVG